MPHRRLVLRALLPFALHGLARAVDGSIGILLHSSLEVASPGGVLGLLVAAPGTTATTIGGWTMAGTLAWVALAASRTSLGLGAALGREAGAFSPLYLRPAVSVLALVSLGLKPAYPYAFTLPVALTQDWGLGQDALALAWFLAARGLRVRLPAPRTGAVFFMTFLLYAVLTPEWARRWEGHPGNEPKYLRQAVAIGHGLTLDAEGVSAPMEELAPMALGPALGRAASSLAGETLLMAEALARGPSALGAEAIRATKITRQTIRGKAGGVYYVLAPGPSLLLAPTLRIDRALNRLRGTPGRLAASVLAWNALGAALVAALFRLLRDASGRPGLAAVLAGVFALTPPFLFYFFQFYPEMLGALVLALVFRALAFDKAWTTGGALGLGGMVAALPWLHQKFLPVWGVLVLTALLVFRIRGARPRAFAALLLPQVLSAFLTALYNFAITGSARPDALFLAWGPGGVTTARIGQGLLGLLFDSRYGIVPYAPLYLLAAAGLVLAVRDRSPLLVALPAAVVYYATVAGADNWAGAVCNLGRYFMPIAPLAVAFVALAVHRASGRPGAAAVALAFVAGTGLVAVALWRDPHAANDSAVLLAQSAIGDGHVYVPGLFIRRWSDGAPGLFIRIAVWAAAAAGLAIWWPRSGRGRGGGSAARGAVGLLACVLLAALGLERWPSTRTAPAFPGEVAVDATTTAFLSGSLARRDDTLVAETGTVDLLTRSAEPRASLPVLIGGAGVYRVAGLARSARPSGAWVEVPLLPVATLRDGAGRREVLARGSFTVEGEVVIRMREDGEPPAMSPR